MHRGETAIHADLYNPITTYALVIIHIVYSFIKTKPHNKASKHRRGLKAFFLSPAESQVALEKSKAVAEAMLKDFTTGCLQNCYRRKFVSKFVSVHENRKLGN